MPASADEILQNHVKANLDVCSRCFNNTMSKQDIRSGIAGGPACSERCGKIDIEMETAPQSDTILKPRAARLISILESENIDIDTELLRLAIEDNADEHPPRKVFEIALEYALGQRDEDDLLPDSDPERDRDKKKKRRRWGRKPCETLPERLADGPAAESELKKFDTDPDSMDELSSFLIPMGVKDVYYLERPKEFAKQHGLEEIDAHSPRAVIYTAIKANWVRLQDASPPTIRDWIDEMDDEYSQHVLEASVIANPYDPFKEHHESFRSTGFWKLVKPQKAEPILGYMRGKANSILTTEEIAEDCGKSERFIRELLKVLSENEYVSRIENSSDEWVYSRD